jgi:hypothetical protein
MSDFSPFADDTASLSIGKLTIENGTNRIALYGSFDLTRDKQGLAQAVTLKAILDRAVGLLTNQHDLPNSIGPDAPTRTVHNPFQ